ncbi:MAG: glucose-1-phosphate cytidylyltransferase [Myxococcota bacterium]
MKTVILAGGLGTRIAEETAVRPKPMVEIGGRPLLWHIMSIYGAHGFDDFLVACGYKGEIIKEYFHRYFDHTSDFVVDLATGEVETLNSAAPKWKVGVVHTGRDTQTGGRIKRLEQWIGGERFMCTYGDGVGNVDVAALVRFHESQGRLATLTAVRPPARFGGLVLEDGGVREFSEKPQTGEGWINGGFFVFEAGVFDYLQGDETILERDPLARLAAEGQLSAYKHEGFWQPMDTLREKQVLDDLWNRGDAPWKIWP